MFTKDNAINLYQPICNNISIRIRGKTPLGRRMSRITPIVLSINQIVPFIISCANNGNPGISTVRAPGRIVIPSVTISAGNGGTMLGPFQPPRNNPTKVPQKRIV